MASQRKTRPSLYRDPRTKATKNRVQTPLAASGQVFRAPPVGAPRRGLAAVPSVAWQRCGRRFPLLSCGAIGKYGVRGLAWGRPRSRFRPSRRGSRSRRRAERRRRWTRRPPTRSHHGFPIPSSEWTRPRRWTNLGAPRDFVSSRGAAVMDRPRNARGSVPRGARSVLTRRSAVRPTPSMAVSCFMGVPLRSARARCRSGTRARRESLRNSRGGRARSAFHVLRTALAAFAPPRAPRRIFAARRWRGAITFASRGANGRATRATCFWPTLTLAA